MAGQEDPAEPPRHARLRHSVSRLLQLPSHSSADNLLIVRSFVGTICLMTVPLADRAQHIGLLISYYITFSFWSAQTLALSLISRNVAGQTKKAIAITVNFVSWSAGNAIGKKGDDVVRSLFSSAVPAVCYIPRRKWRLFRLPHCLAIEARNALANLRVHNRTSGLPELGFSALLHRLCHASRLLLTACHRYSTPPLVPVVAE